MTDIDKAYLYRAEKLLAEAYAEREELKLEVHRRRKEIEQLLKAHAAYEQAITKIEDEWHHD